MVFIINNLKYDTDKMEKIAVVSKWYKNDSWIFQAITGRSDLGNVFDCDLYRSSKGRFLLVHQDGSYYKAEALTEEQAKELLRTGKNYEIYKKYFGEIDEA